MPLDKPKILKAHLSGLLHMYPCIYIHDEVIVAFESIVDVHQTPLVYVALFVVEG